MSFFFGDPGGYEKVSRLRKSQEPIATQAIKAASGKGAGGAFGDVADYYRSNLSNIPADIEAFSQPELRKFREEIIPGISEQFAGMGSGGLSSSGFRNAAVGAGADLSERLGALRAQLRQSSAQGLMGVGQNALQNFDENIYNPGTEGLLGGLGNIAGQALGSFGTGLGLSAGANWLNSSKKGSSNPYGSNVPGTKIPSGGGLPNFSY